MSRDYPFPPLSTKIEIYMRECLREYKVSEEKFEDTENLLGCIGLKGGSEVREEVKNYLKRNLDLKDRDIPVKKAFDLLYEIICTDDIVSDRLYHIVKALNYLESQKIPVPNSFKTSPKKLVELIEGDGKIQTFKVGQSYAVLGEDIPYLKKFMKNPEAPGKRFRYYYPVIEEGEKSILLENVADEMNIDMNRMTFLLRKKPEARELLHRTRYGKERVVVKPKDKGEFIKILKSW